MFSMGIYSPHKIPPTTIVIDQPGPALTLFQFHFKMILVLLTFLFATAFAQVQYFFNSSAGLVPSKLLVLVSGNSISQSEYSLTMVDSGNVLCTTVTDHYADGIISPVQYQTLIFISDGGTVMIYPQPSSFLFTGGEGLFENFSICLSSTDGWVSLSQLNSSFEAISRFQIWNTVEYVGFPIMAFCFLALVSVYFLLVKFDVMELSKKQEKSDTDTEENATSACKFINKAKACLNHPLFSFIKKILLGLYRLSDVISDALLASTILLLFVNTQEIFLIQETNSYLIGLRTSYDQSLSFYNYSTAQCNSNGYFYLKRVTYNNGMSRWTFDSFSQFSYSYIYLNDFSFKCSIDSINLHSASLNSIPVPCNYGTAIAGDVYLCRLISSPFHLIVALIIFSLFSLKNT